MYTVKEKLKNKKFIDNEKLNVIYICAALDSEKHKGLLKIGQTSINVLDIDNEIDTIDNSDKLMKAAKARANSMCGASGFSLDVLYSHISNHSDKEVHKLLKHNGIKQYKFEDSNAREWFICSLDEAKDAIKKVDQEKKEINLDQTEPKKIIFRDEQRECINKVCKYFQKNPNGSFLMNIKMRGGKTLITLEIVKKCSFKRTLLITHRPVVKGQWEESFRDIFTNEEEYLYGYKDKAAISYYEKQLAEEGKKYIYFVSTQDIRGSAEVGGMYEKYKDLYNIEFDCLIIDEAHEGTLSDKSKKAIDNIKRKKTISLSGTPFNINEFYTEEQTYNYTYLEEQINKKRYENMDNNPYEDMPRLNIYTYNLSNKFNEELYLDEEEKYFSFKEFFRVENNGFKYVDDVRKFLDILAGLDNKDYFPFSTEENREIFNHTFWKLPSVKAVEELEKEMKKHKIFGTNKYEIINVAGENDQGLDYVKETIEKCEEEGINTITLSCGRLTTGVTIPQWKAVLLLYGSGDVDTSSMNYLQTIFRCQTPYIYKNKRKKTECYAFDFLPDRTLTCICDLVNKDKYDDEEEYSKKIGNLLNYLPVIKEEGSRVVKYNTETLINNINTSMITRVINNGFYDKNILNIKELENPDENAIYLIRSLDIDFNKNSKQVVVTKHGFDKPIYEDESDEYEKKSSETKKYKKRNNNKKNSRLINILKNIATKFPLLIYGMEVNYEEDINIDKITELIDDESWEEIMGTELNKEIFNTYIKNFFNKIIFNNALKEFVKRLKDIDDIDPSDRVKKLTRIVRIFKNLNKKRIITSWKMVNMHVYNTIGGSTFFDDNFEIENELSSRVNPNVISENIFKKRNVKIFELFSTLGLYSLHMANNCYKNRFNRGNNKKNIDIWKEIIKNNIYVLCETKITKNIIKRTLLGYKEGESNIIHINKLDDKIKTPQGKEEIIKEIKEYLNKKGEDDSKIDIIVGGILHQTYVHYMDIGFKLDPIYMSLMTPLSFFTTEKKDKGIRKIIKDKQNQIEKYYIHNSNTLINGVHIVGGVGYFLYDKNYDSKGKIEWYEYDKNNKYKKYYRPLFYEELGDIIIVSEINSKSIIKKIKNNTFKFLIDIVSEHNPFKMRKTGDINNVSEENPDETKKIIYKLICSSKNIRYVSKDIIIKNKNLFESYKIYVPAIGYSKPNDKKIIRSPLLGEKNTVCSSYYLCIGNFDNQIEANNLLKYMKTKFLRYLLSIKKRGPNISNQVYSYVPLLDFTDKSDIDWSFENIEEIDDQLYKKYNLTNKEISTIKNKIDYID